MSIQIKNNKGSQVEDVNGVKYFKLVSPYAGDYTKNCGLLANEIDENFFFLRGYDIKNMDIDDERNLVLHRVNGEKLVVNIEQNIEYPSFEFDKEEGKIIVTYPDGSVEILDGFMVEGQSYRVATDYTIKGDGRISNPLRLSNIEKTGTYAPALSFHDLTVSGSSMPEPVNGKGTRYVTKEYFSPFGALYTFEGVKEIQRALEERQSLWRVPTNEDWGLLLNAAELCPEDRNHVSEDENRWLGKIAGKRAKAIDLWDPYPDGGEVHSDDSLPGGGQQKFHVLPVGVGTQVDEFCNDTMRRNAQFWSITTTRDLENPNVYTRLFSYKTDKVEINSSDPEDKFSLRLVRDFDYSNFDEYEEILGQIFPCVLINNPDTNYCKLWTRINVDFGEGLFGGYKPEAWSAITSEEDRVKQEAYYINEWDGEKWLKKQMNPGDSVVILDYDGDPSTSGDTYHEWRVILHDDGTSELVDTVEALRNELKEEIDAINDRVNELSGTVADLSEKLDEEIERAKDAESALTQEIDVLADAVDELNDDVTELNEKIDNLDEKIDSIESAITIELNEIKEKLDILSGDVQELNDKLDSLQTQVDDIQGNLIDSGEMSLENGKITLTKRNGELISFDIDSNFGELPSAQ